MKESKSRIASAMFLVAGTSIGGGMLALPVATGISGFIPSISMMLICWIAMTLSALLLVEANLWMEDEAHVITMATRLLGPFWKGVCWLLYLFICYASLTAYTAAGGLQVSDAAHSLLGFEISKDCGALIFVIFFGSLFYLGPLLIGRVNTTLFVAMIGAYIALVGIGFDEVKSHLLAQKNWSYSLLAIPVLLTTFSFQTLVPSLTPYLKRNVRELRWAIIGGTTLTLIIYVLWQYMILGIVPIEGGNGLAEALARGEPATQFVREHVVGRWVGTIAEFFAFFAIITSFIGIGFGLFDFLADGLHIKKEGWGKLLLGMLIIIPTLVFAVRFERIFILALDTTGGFGDTLLNGMIPVMMVWVGRYQQKLGGEKIVRGGKVALLLIFAFFFAAFMMQGLAYTGLITSFHGAYEMVPDTERAIVD